MHIPICNAEQSNRCARATWEVTAVGCRRSRAGKGTRQYFEDLREYRYGYETPFIPRVFDFAGMAGKQVLEIGVGNGVDGVEMARYGATYTGLDITENHLELTRKNFAIHVPDRTPTLISGDLLQTELHERFDVIYSFGVLHHIHHEPQYLKKLATLLKPEGRLMIAVYSKWSFFNIYMIARWLLSRGRWQSLDDWRSHFAEGSAPGNPVTIRIRSRREVEQVLRAAGFRVEKYEKCGFVQRYLPMIGSRLAPDGSMLRLLARCLGWDHAFECRLED